MGDAAWGKIQAESTGSLINLWRGTMEAWTQAKAGHVQESCGVLQPANIHILPPEVSTEELINNQHGLGPSLQMHIHTYCAGLNRCGQQLVHPAQHGALARIAALKATTWMGKDYYRTK